MVSAVAPVWSMDGIATDTFSTPFTNAFRFVPSHVIAKWTHWSLLAMRPLDLLSPDGSVEPLVNGSIVPMPPDVVPKSRPKPSLFRLFDQLKNVVFVSADLLDEMT